MRKLLFPILLFTAFFAKSQSGGQRTCGSDYTNYGLNGATYEAALDTAGQWHNDFQDYFLNRIVNENVDPTSPGFGEFFKKATIDFFTTKGIDANHLPYPDPFDPLDASIYTVKGLSKDGQAILYDLQKLVNAGLSTKDFTTAATSLKNRALNLKDESEVIKVGLPVTIGIYSNNYWSINADRWAATLSGGNNGNANQRSVHIGLGQLGAADIGGAITGAVEGIVAGPGGSLAGGILGAATASAGNLLGQIFSSFAPSWW